jgi:hypothetical protein
LARQCRTLIYGAAVPPRHRPCRADMHGAAMLICRAVTLGTSKSVSFENKKLSVLNLKIVSKKC